MVRLLLAALASLVDVGYGFRAPEPLPISTVSVNRGRVEETVTNTRAGTVMARQRAK